jgi:uncharacterized protein (DUF58 family)
VLLHTRRAPGSEFEAAVRRAASETLSHLEAGYRVALSTDGQRFEPGEGHGHRARLLAFLARVTPEPGDEAAAPPRREREAS